MNKEGWQREELELLYKLKTETNMTWREIALRLNKTKDSIEKKFKRTNWNSFLNNNINNDESRQIWDQQEMIQLHTYLDSGKSYSYIAEKLKRSVTSVERKAQSTDWNAWHTATFHKVGNGEEKVTEKEEMIEQLVSSMVYFSRNEYSRIQEMKKDDFLESINLTEKELPISFTNIKDLACKTLDSFGLSNEKTLELGQGTYIVIGDTHGKHTKRKMFDLINQMSKQLKTKNIIHVGHLLDDDNEISYKLGDLQNLIVLAKEEELKIVHKRKNSHNCSYKIVVEEISLGDDLIITTQDMIEDYAKTPIRNLDSEIFDGKMIVNCHRLESSSKASSDGSSNYLVSPGCICERHIIRTIKQIDFKDGKTVKLANHEGFSKYRKMKHNYRHWTQGLLVVNVDENGDHTIIPCLIRKYKDDYYTSYFDKIYSSSGVFSPDNKIFIHADMHVPKHDCDVLDIQEQICADYKPNQLVNIGDSLDCSTLNHHEMDKGCVIFGNYLSETAKTSYVLSRMRNWANECHIIVGNHERFIQDFIKKYPQLESILDFQFACNVKEMGYRVTELKEVLEIGDANFLHGDMMIYNQTGNKLEKTSRTFGHNTFIGHIHYPSIRFGCYSVGFAGKMDQGYNEKEASAWIHGFGMCNQYKGMSWPTTIAIFNKKVIFNGKSYTSQNPNNWDIDGFKAKIVYEYQGKSNC